VFVAAALAMWFGIKREDLVSAETKVAATTGKNDDPNFGAQV
jgi:preprotein translocase subunit SecF